jgi:hypothetical protein
MTYFPSHSGGTGREGQTMQGTTVGRTRGSTITDRRELRQRSIASGPSVRRILLLVERESLNR